MPSTYVQPRYASLPPPASGRDEAAVVVAGGGLVGLTAALDLARRGVRTVMLDEDETVSFGSRAICFAKRTLEIYGRLGLGERFLKKGVTWHTGRVYKRDRETYAFDLLPEQGHQFPAFVNLQQYYAEDWLVEACAATGLVDLRWKHRITGIAPRGDGAALTVETPGGAYTLDAQWVLAADGARSTIREAMGLPFLGQVFRDRFLVADVVMHAPFPAERRFWFDPSFHPGQSVLLHKQPDDVWRIDFQLDQDADPEFEKEPARVEARVRQMLGPNMPFSLDWISVYTFCCRRIERFRHGHVLFLGDSAHQVSPFGARGGNGGVQDADNLCWKLAAVLKGSAPDSLLDSYGAERIPAADENIVNSTRSTDFITPKNDAARAYRAAVLDLSATYAFARPLVNSGRLSRPAVLRDSPLSSPDAGTWDGGLPTGTPASDAPVMDAAGRDRWLLSQIGADGGFTLLCFDTVVDAPGITSLRITATPAPGALHDHSGLAAARFGATAGDAVLLRPDQHIAARFRAGNATPAAIAAAYRRALGEAA